MSFDENGLELTLPVHRDAAVEQQVVVIAEVRMPFFVQKADVPVEALALAEGVLEPRQHALLFRREVVGMLGVHCGKIDRAQRPVSAADPHGFRLAVDFVQQQPVFHLVLRVPLDDLPFDLEQDDRDCLPGGLVGVAVFFVDFLREQRERPQAHGVALFQHVHVPVADAVPDHRGHAGIAARRGAHPQDVVVAPFDVERMVAHQKLHNRVRPGAAVENIPHDVQMVDRQPLDEGGERFDEVVSAAEPDERVDDFFVVDHLVVVLVRLGVKQFVQNIAVGFWHRLAHFGARVFGRKHLGELNHALDGVAVPVR